MNSFGSFFQLKLLFFNACHIDLRSVKQWVLLFYRVADIRGSWCNLSCFLFKITHPHYFDIDGFDHVIYCFFTNFTLLYTPLKFGTMS